MNVLIFHPSQEAIEMISFCLESQTGIVVKQADTFHKIVDVFLEDTSIDLIITAHQSEADKLFKYVLSTNSNIPFIIVGKELKTKSTAFPDLKILGHILESEVPDKIVSIIQENFLKIMSSQPESQYCRIQTELLLRVTPLKSDIYIKLSSVKFVKMFQAGSLFSQDDYEKYFIKRKLNYFYIKNSEIHEFVSKFKNDLAMLVDNILPNDPNLMDQVAGIHDAVNELSSRVGFTKEVQEIAKQSVKLALKGIGKSKKLSMVISNSLLKDKNYLSSHSIFLANISCSIAAQLEWNSNLTFEKLVMASLFHDILFHNSDLAKISSKSELESLKSILPADQYDLVRTHSIRCADLLRTMNEVPADVDVITLEHHEKPDGSGFPRGLFAHQISPLSAVLIVAHELVEEIMKKNKDFSLKSYLSQLNESYNLGSFKKVIQILQSLADEDAASDENSDAA